MNRAYPVYAHDPLPVVGRGRKPLPIVGVGC